MYKTAQERKQARRSSVFKYNRSAKRKLVNSRYRGTHKKQCSAWSIAWQKRNRERVMRLERRRNSTPKGKAIRQAIQKRYNANNRFKRLAKDAVNNAIRAGKLKVFPCEVCGKKAQGHHSDYKKPLKVVWLCPQHHQELHRRLKKNSQK